MLFETVVGKLTTSLFTRTRADLYVYVREERNINTLHHTNINRESQVKAGKLTEKRRSKEPLLYPCVLNPDCSIIRMGR